MFQQLRKLMKSDTVENTDINLCILNLGFPEYLECIKWIPNHLFSHDQITKLKFRRIKNEHDKMFYLNCYQSIYFNQLGVTNNISQQN